MIHTSNYELTVCIAIPLTLIVQLWTLVIFNRNKSSWRPYDIPVVAILTECTLRNICIAVYITIQKLGVFSSFDYCDIFAWTFNSAHTFHASTLATLAVIAVFSLKLHNRRESLRHYLTPTHVVYHLVCLTTLCACVGVAAILAKPEARYAFIATFNNSSSKHGEECDLLPHQLDVKYNAFIVVLHSFLAAIGLVAIVYTCVLYAGVKRRGGFEGYRKKSSSDLSELSMSSMAAGVRGDKGFYDTYTIQRLSHQQQQQQQQQHGGFNGFNGGYDGGYATMWKSDFSQLSTTVSSTNSRRPLNATGSGAGVATIERKLEEYLGTGLATINPILIVCYAFYHLPIIALCIFPSLIAPWSVSNVILWLGLLQDVLLPISLGIVDTRFNAWVSRVYRCAGNRQIEGKLPHMGLDGKFRHFSASQPQSLEINQMHPLRCYTSPSTNTATTTTTTTTAPDHLHHKFPITNGSLYTSIDGRVPVIHNYRRHIGDHHNHQQHNLHLHSANLQRSSMRNDNYACRNYSFPEAKRLQIVTTTAPVPVSVASHHHHHQHPHFNQGATHANLLKPYLRHVSLSQSSLRQMPLGNEEATKIRSKSYESLNEVAIIETPQQTQQQREQEEDDEYRDYEESSSTSSSFSITTEANGDFEFFHHGAEGGGGGGRGKDQGFKIKRSNSKRSLENLQAYIDEDYFSQQSDSLQHTLSTLSAEKSLSAEFLSAHAERDWRRAPFVPPPAAYAGSVPDLKKVFISEYL